jgi:protein TonB
MLAHHRGPYKQSVVLALVVLLALFVFFPPFEFTPYALQAEEEEIEVVEIQPDIVIPPPPKPVPPPPIPVPDPDPDNKEDPMPPTTWQEGSFPPPPPPGAGKKEDFVPFDDLPVPEYIARPVYPELAREAGIEGTVLLQVKVGLDHNVHEAIVLDSDVTPAMERAAIEAALQCKYKPAMQQGVEVEVWVSIRIEFRLN